MSIGDGAAREVIPNTVRIAELQQEKGRLLESVRKHQVIRDEASRSYDSDEAKLRLVEAALHGVDLGIGHAKEAATESEKQGTGGPDK